MNHFYRSIWNEATGAYVAVSENASNGGRKTKALALTLAVAISPQLQALPVNGVVTAGQASVSASGASMTVQQTSQNAALDWNSFSIGQGEAVRFVQPNSSAVALNRVIGSDPSAILGNLSANGKVFLVNPNGILFGAGVSVNVGGLVASTLDIGTGDFMAGRYTFAGSSAAPVHNAGTIQADSGYVALLGARVSNQGVIAARLGSIALAAGQAVTLDVAGDGLINVAIDRGAAGALVSNGGMIAADGGQVLLSAQSAGSLMHTAVNNTGVVQAQTIDTRSGSIKLMGGMHDGSVSVAGKLDASAPGQGAGGFIETSAAHVAVADGAVITTRAAGGPAGTWLIDPIDFTIAAGGGALTTSGIGASTLATSLAGGNVSIATDASTGGNGDIFVDSAVSWAANKLTLTAHRNINVNANLNASVTASLALEYGQGAVAAGNTSSVITNGGVVNLPAGTTNFTTKLGSNGATKAYTVITSLGAAGSTTATDLQGMNGNLALNYALGANIDAAATSAWNAGAGFLPVSTNASRYSGNFDGLGHTIANLVINRPSTSWVGLFGHADTGSELRNVGLVNASIGAGSVVGALTGMNYGEVRNSYMTGSVVGASFLAGLVGSNNGNVRDSYATGMISGADQVGGLVGGHNAGTISNSFATGNVTGTGGATGGLVGYSSGTISTSHASGAVAGASGVGGLLAAMNGGTVSNSYATGSISGVNVVGGLIGNSTNGTLNNVYATGAVTGAADVGGLIGSTNNATVNNSYAAGLVTATGTAGGLIGTRSGTVTNGYWNSTVNGATGIGSGATTGATGLTSAQMQSAANFAGFAFTSTPGAAGNNWVMVDIDSSLNNAGGEAGATLPMLTSEYGTTINDAHQLQLMNMALGGSYKLGRNIDAAATAVSTDVWSGSTFVPIGSVADFTGSLAGQGYSINNLKVNLPLATNVGLFGYLGVGSVVSNLGIVGGTVTGNDYVGALAGFNEGTINDTYATAAVAGSANRVGGLIGHDQSGTLNNTYATGAVSGAAVLGGLIGGANGSGTISNSYATGSVTGTTYLGGLVGAQEGGTISNSYATGAVSGSGANVGGLTGYTFATTISNTYATGATSGSGSVGGLVGFRNEGGAGPSTITNSYWNTDIQAAGMGSGISTGATGLSTAQMMVPANLTGFAFTTTAGASGNNWVTVGADGTLNSNGGGGTLPMLASEYSTSIANGHQLQLVRMNLAGSYAQTQDIDLSAAMSSASGQWGPTGGFVPIGGVFTGTYDGQGKTISGLKLNRPAQVYQGLFGATSAASTIRNVGLIGGSATGDTYIGALVGRLGGTISNSYATVDVAANFYMGGLVGYTETGSLVTNSYASGSVTGPRAGGLVGRNDGTVSNSYASGAVSGSNSGGLIGLNNGGTITNSFWNSTTSGKATSDGGTGLASAAMMQLASFSSWNAAPNTIANTFSSGAVWRLYEGHTAPLLTGFMNKLTLSGAPDVAATYNAALQTGATIAAPGGVLGAAASGTNAGTYNGYYSTQLGYNLLGGNLVIGKAALTLSGTRAFDGSTVVAGSKLTATGVGGETFALTGTGNVGNLASKNVQSGSTLASLSGLALGASGNGGQAANYNAISTTGSAFSVTPADITLSTSNVSKIYDGTLTAAGSAAVASGTLFGTDSLSGGTFAFVDPNAGTGDKVVTASGITLTDGNGGANYNVSYASNTTSTISRKSLTASVSTPGKAYDGNTSAPATLTITAGLAGGQTLGTTATASYNSKDVLTANLVTVNSVLLADGTGLASNYTLAAGQTVAATITPKALTATASAAGKTYDGNTTAAATLAITGGLVGAEVVTATGAATFNSKNVLTANLVTVNSTSLANGTGLASNYSLASGQSAAATITPKALTATASASGKTYDGNTTAAATLAITGGLIGAEVVTATGGATFNSKDVLSANLVTVNSTALVDGTGLASNYSLAAGQTAAASIAPKALTAAASASDKTYDGNTSAAATLAITGGLVGAEVVTATGGATFNSKDVLSANLVTFNTATLVDGTGLASNYSLAPGQSTAAAILAKALTASASASSKTYDGNTTAAVTLAITGGLVGAEVVTATGGATFNSKDVLTANLVTVNSTALVDGTGLASNYSLASGQSAAATITPKALTATLSASDKTYDGNTTAAATLAVSGGLVGAEVVTATGGATFNSKDVLSANLVTVNSTALVDGTGLASNYSLAAGQSAAAAITPKALTASASASDKTYDGNTSAAATLAITGGLVGAEVVTATGGATFNSKDVLSANLVTFNSATLVDGTGLASNYSLAPGQSTAAAILAKALTASASASSKTYDGSTTATGTLSITGGLVGAEVVTATGSATFNSKDVLAANLVTFNSTALADGTGLASNYILASGQSAAAAITPKALTASASASGKTYDGNTSAAATLAITGGLVGAETVGATGAATFNSKDVLTANLVTVNSVALADGTGLASNYSLAPGQTTAASIAAKALTASMAASSKTYDGNTAAAATLSITGGLVGAETVGASATASFNSKDVLTANLVTADSVMLSDGTGLASNYSLAPGQSAAAAIFAKAITASATASGKTYDGSTSAAGMLSITGGLVGAETLGVGGTATFNSKDVLTANMVTFDSATLVDGSGLASNYSLAAGQTAAATITAKALTASAGASDKIYDGNTGATVAMAITGGLVGSEVVGATGSATFNSKDVLSANLVTVNSTALIDGTGLASNYSLAPGQTSAAAILAKALGATASATAKVYDGNTSAAATLAITGGLVAGESVNASGLASFNSKDVLAANLVTFDSVALTDGTGLASNYSLAPGQTATASITPKALTASASASGKTYDGTTAAAATLAITGGLVGTETVGAAATASFNSKDVLSANLVTVDGITLLDGTGLAGNYSLAPGQTATAAITPKTLTVTGMTALDRAYNGGTAATLSGGALAGLAGSETLVFSGHTGVFADKNVGVLKPVTVSGIGLSNGSGLASNYTIGNPLGLTASISRLASVAWTGGATGNWFDAANWAGGALPDLANVAAVTLPAGVTATFGNGSAVNLNTIDGAGSLGMVDGSLNVTGNIALSSIGQTGGTLASGGDISVGSFTQSGGTLAAGGKFTATSAFTQGSTGSVSAGGAIGITQASGSTVLGNLATRTTLDVTAVTGSISQAPNTSITSVGAATMSAPSGSVQLASTGNSFGTAVIGNANAVRVQGALGSAMSAQLNGPDDPLSRPYAGTTTGGPTLAGLNVTVVGQGVRLPPGLTPASETDEEKKARRSALP